MVEINSFKQAFQLYQSSQLSLAVTQHLAFMLMNACDAIPPNFHGYTDINTGNLTWLANQLAAEFSFDEYLGGNVYICEFESDLLAIVAFDQDWADQYGRWPNVTDKPLVWDLCLVLNDEWAVFGYCWNNAGGAVYYIPRSLWERARVGEHKEVNPD